MRRFNVLRREDVSGVSGTGIVAEGVEFTDGHVVIRWKCRGKPSSTSFWDSVEELLAIHGHGDATVVSWIDA